VSAGSVRAGIRDFVTAGNIDGLAKVYLDYPWRLAGTALAIDPARGWGAVAWPHLDHQGERRLTFPAGSGSKQVDYKVGLLTVFQYRIPPQLPDGADEDAWSPVHDAFLDAVVARLRSDQTLGGAVLQAGEGTDGGEQLAIRRDLPRIDGGILHSWTAIEFTATEIVTA
jgi:hypothetical protein